MSKYGAKKTEIDGIRFDSKREAAYYSELKLLKMAGELDFELQPKFTLIEGFEKNGKKYRPTHYIADFLITYRDGRKVVIDVKGFETKDFKIKAKLFNQRYPELELRLVK